MKNLTTIAKLSLAGVLYIGALALSGCGDNLNSVQKRILKDYPDVQFVSFDEIKKEFGLKSEECLKKQNEFDHYYYLSFYFVKEPSGEIKAVRFADLIKNPTDDSMIISGKYPIDGVKKMRSECFN